MNQQVSSKGTFIFKLLSILFFLPGLFLFLKDDRIVLKIVAYATFIIFTSPFWWIMLNSKYVSIRNQHLIISNYIKTIKVELSNIKCIEDRFLSAKIIFSESTKFGKKIIFIPPYRSNYFKPNPVITEIRKMINKLDKKL